MMSRYPGVPQDGSRLESSHNRHKGRGGDVTGRVSWKKSDYVTLTLKQHARIGKTLKYEVGPEGGDGPVHFYTRPSIHGLWEWIGRSVPPREDAA